MAYPRLLILGYSEASMAMRDAAVAAQVAAVLAIHGRREFGVEADVERRLDLHFDDVEAPAADDMRGQWRARQRQRWCEANGLTETPPTHDDAAAIIRFAESLAQVEGALLCHCFGGMSRSPAAALICLAVWRGPGEEQACAEQVRALRRGATPHVGLVVWLMNCSAGAGHCWPRCSLDGATHVPACGCGNPPNSLTILQDRESDGVSSIGCNKEFTRAGGCGLDHVRGRRFQAAGGLVRSITK